ncbi:MAG: outer membrane beta-barrel protein [Bacteroidales bacterium]|nr:outer membrane beta-barrel protein [Bacteroidales bacterium]
MGTVSDENNNVLVGVNVVLSSRDSTFVTGTTTNSLGRFVLPLSQQGSFTLAFSYVGYKSESRHFSFNGSAIDLGNITLFADVKVIGEVEISELNPAVKLIGDTTEFSANSYKVNANATAEDLISKMPGITVEDGVVKAHGEEIKKVYVDGKEFFGDDASIAFKNIPADIIDKIQVYDKMSDMAEFTGFRDGETTKTVNIKTLQGMNDGWFGKVNGGYGTDNKYSAGGNINYFHDDLRISVIGLSNNVNQQNFSMQDMIGIASSSGGRGGPPAGGGNSNVPGPPENNDISQGNTMSNYFVGQNSGINTINSYGLNIVDSWSSKLNFTASYFFNQTKNNTNSLTDRDYVLQDDNINKYLEDQSSESNNLNHRIKVRLEYKINGSNSLILSPGLSLQNLRSGSVISTVSTVNSLPSSGSETINSRKYSAISSNSSLVYRHKFSKTGRTISVNGVIDYSDKNGYLLQNAINYSQISDDSVFVDQKNESLSYSNTLNSNIVYTEPIGEFSQLLINFSPSFSKSVSDKNVFNKSVDFYDLVPDTVLSDYYSFETHKYKTGAGFRYNKNKINLNLGVDYQYLILSGNSEDSEIATMKTFNSILPKFDMFYNIDKGQFLHLNLSSTSSVPTVSQLQDVIDNSNTTSLIQGNPDLGQQRTNSFHLAFRRVDKSFNKSLFFVVSGQMSDNYIVSTNYTALNDSVLNGGIVLYSGSQLNSYLNMKGYSNLRSFLTFSLPIKPIRCSISFNGGYSWSKLPGLVNNEVNTVVSDYPFAGISINSNISDNIDFRVSYSSGYNMVNNELQSTSNYNYYSGKLTHFALNLKKTVAVQ